MVNVIGLGYIGLPTALMMASHGVEVIGTDYNTGKNIIGIRHGEKLYETLMTREERLRAEDMGRYFRVSTDNRDLNYDKYFVKGQVQTMSEEAYTSHNTTRLDVERTVKKILKDMVSSYCPLYQRKVRP